MRSSDKDPHKCVCKSVFKQRKDLLKHIRKYHLNQQKAPPNTEDKFEDLIIHRKEDPKPWHCKECTDKKFAEKKNPLETFPRCAWRSSATPTCLRIDE
jgi:hypothetical protein